MSAPSLTAAIVADLTAAMLDGPAEVTGGIYSVKVPDGAPLPYAKFRERSSRQELRTSDATVYVVQIEMRVYGRDEDMAGSLGDAVDAEMGGPVGGPGRAFAFGGGQTTPLVREGEPRHDKEPKRGPDGEVWYQERVYDCRVIRTRS